MRGIKYEVVRHEIVLSKYLQRPVVLHFYFPINISFNNGISLLLINDGQDMKAMGFERILDALYGHDALEPLLCVAIDAGQQRIQEYGIEKYPDYLNRGATAAAYTQFILKELLPLIKKETGIKKFNETAFAGFSLGGLSAMDIVWNNPKIFSKVGVFSGSFWWRSVDQFHKNYDDDKHRIMQQVIRKGKYRNAQKYFFQCGKMDEANDRNNNGIIDAIDDTLDIIKELIQSGCPKENIAYLELDDGKHDVPSWGKAMPVFLNWGWGKKMQP